MRKDYLQIIKKILLNYINKSADWDYDLIDCEDIRQLKNLIRKTKDRKFLERNLYELISYQKKCLKYERWPEYYDTIFI